MKLPSLQFYPGDWQKDPNLRRCSHAAKGVLMDMICLMHESEHRGILSTGGVPWTLDDIAEAIGGPKTETLTHINELLKKGVLRQQEDGAVFSARMVRDEAKRVSDKLNGKKGGNPMIKAINGATHPYSQSAPNSPSSSSCIPLNGGLRGGLTPPEDEDEDEREVQTGTEGSREGNQPSTGELRPEPKTATDNRPKGLMPGSEGEAVEMMGLAAIPKDFTINLFYECNGVGFIDGSHRPIANWPSYVRQRWVKSRRVGVNGGVNPPLKAGGNPQVNPASGGGAQNGVNQPTAYTLTKQREAIEEELKELKNRGHEDAFGAHYRNEDKPRVNELKAALKAVKQKMTTLT